MNSLPELADPTVEELRDDALTDMLFEGLAPLRPDADAFAAGVRASIEDACRQSPMVVSPWLRVAASLVPPMALPKSLTTTLGAAVATKASAKILPTVVMLPVATFAAVVVSLLFVLRAAFAKGIDVEQRTDAKLAREELQAWWGDHIWLKFLSIALLCVLVAISPMVALTLGCVSFSVGLLVVCNRLARAGLATRDEIARTARGGLLFVGAQLTTLPVLEVDPLMAAAGGVGVFPVQRGLMLVTPVLLAAACYCHLRIRARELRDRVFLPIVALLIAGYGIIMSQQRSRVILETFARVDAVVTQSAFPPHADTVALLDAVARQAGLGGVGRQALATFATRVGDTESQLVAHGFVELGLVDDARKRAWLESAPRFYADPLALAEKPALAKSISFAGWMMLKAEALRADPARRDAYADIVVRAFAEPHEHDSLVQLHWTVRALEGCGADVGRLRGRAHELLVACANRDEDGTRTGFLPVRASRNLQRVYPGFSAPEAAAAATLLMTKFGVPDGIDLASVDRALVRSLHIVGESNSMDAHLAFATQHALRAMPGHEAEERGPLRVVAEWQTAFAAVVLALGAVVVTLRARPVA
ncbi:MAG: hypothetical protein RIT24_2235 [Planctomycetota bacterium]